LGVDPYREDLYQLALRCQIMSGQRSAAIETFIECKTQLAEQLGLDPASETMRLYQQILAMEDAPRYDAYGLS
jgi:DNA-binding SARP family transcriptional activator